MKKFTLLFAAILMTFALSGCGSMFSTGDSKPAEAGQTTDIQITESYTHKDPEGMEYATRYAYTSGKNVQEMVDSFKEYYDLDMVEQLMIIYADADDKPLAQYDYYVLADEENAKKCAEMLGGDMFTSEGNVVIGISDAETTQMMIDMNIQYGSLKADSVSEYALFMKDVNAFSEIQ